MKMFFIIDVHLSIHTHFPPPCRSPYMHCTGLGQLSNRLFNHSMRDENMLANLGKSGAGKDEGRVQKITVLVKTEK